MWAPHIWLSSPSKGELGPLLIITPHFLEELRLLLSFSLLYFHPSVLQPGVKWTSGPASPSASAPCGARLTDVHHWRSLWRTRVTLSQGSLCYSKPQFQKVLSDFRYMTFVQIKPHTTSTAVLSKWLIFFIFFSPPPFFNQPQLVFLLLFFAPVLSKLLDSFRIQLKMRHALFISTENLAINRKGKAVWQSPW